MKPIIAPLDKEILEKELTSDKFIRQSNNASNEIYSINHHNSPNLMREIGRLRELTFREAGGGTGKEIDIDKFDTADEPYQQLIVWDPSEKEILGGYRYILCNKIISSEASETKLATSGLFNFSEKFKKEYLPHTIELGRPFVQPKYQSSRAGRKALFALDNLWDGLGALVVDYPEIKYFFGKVTMYTSYNIEARNRILYFLNRFFPDKENLLKPITALETNIDKEFLDNVFIGKDYAENYKILGKEVRKFNENIPPLVNTYMNLTETMNVFGTAMNRNFGEVEETGILITISDIFPKKKERHINSYIKK